MFADTGDVVFYADNTFTLTEIRFKELNPADPDTEWDYVHIGDFDGTWRIQDMKLIMDFEEAWQGYKTNRRQLQIKTDTNTVEGDGLYLTTTPDFSP